MSHCTNGMQVVEVWEEERWLCEDIDGVVLFMDDEGLYHYLPFRSEEKGGICQDPPIWKWENPDEPVRRATLTPEFLTEKVNVGIARGVVHKL